MRIEKRCGRCSTAVSGRRCEECGSAPSWGFIIEDGKRDGRRHRIVRRGFTTKAEAGEAGVVLAAELAADEFVAPSSTTISKWLDDWIGSQRQNLKPSTLASYQSIIETHLKPVLGDLRLQDLHRSHLESYYVRLANGSVKSGTVKNVHAVLRKALADAVSRSLLTSNPAVDAFKIRVQREEMSVWTEEELRFFLGHVRSHRVGPLMRIAAMTGMRRGEILGLKWRDVDATAGVIHVNRALTRGSTGPVLVEPKTSRARRAIELDNETAGQLGAWKPAQLEEALQFGRASWNQNNKNGLIFTRSDGSPSDPDTVSHLFTKLCIGAGVPVIRFHDLRHTHATLLLKDNTPLHVVSRRLGHSSAAFTADRYSHVLPGQAFEAVSRLSAMVD